MGSPTAHIRPGSGSGSGSRSGSGSGFGSGSGPSPGPGHLDVEELTAAWQLLRSAARRLDRIAEQEGWPTPFGPVRYLILSRLRGATAYGLSPRHLARWLAMSPSTLAHHLDVLEGAGLVRRAAWTLYDRRKVAVRLTEAGLYALGRLTRSHEGG